MTDKSIARYIKLLNGKRPVKTIFLHKIGKNVEIGKVWKKYPLETDKVDYNFHPFTFFFIKNEYNEYVGAVEDRVEDLHWYILPKHRNKGYLSSALKTVIIPYIFYERDKQRISIDIDMIGHKNYKNSKRVAERIGFQKNDISTRVEEYILHKENFDFSNEALSDSVKILTNEEKEKIKREFNFISKKIFMLKNQLEFTSVYNEELTDVIRILRELMHNVE